MDTFEYELPFTDDRPPAKITPKIESTELTDCLCEINLPVPDVGKVVTKYIQIYQDSASPSLIRYSLLVRTGVMETDFYLMLGIFQHLTGLELQGPLEIYEDEDSFERTVQGILLTPDSEQIDFYLNDMYGWISVTITGTAKQMHAHKNYYDRAIVVAVAKSSDRNIFI